MSRLADYFAVIGYSHEKDHNNVCCGKILQRFPEKDWSDCPFMAGLPLFCQPMGWALSRYQKQPSFYVAVLTDMDGERHYCAVFTFHEMIASPLSKPDDEDDDQDRNNMHQSALFAPKSLVLVSRHDYFESFRNCLSVIYTVYLDNMAVKIEPLIGNMLGCIHVPPAGGPQVRFSLGAGDRQVLQPPLSATLPISNTSVAILFEQLGINNTLTVFSAALTDHKILFYSESCSRLCEASRAIASLHYPLKYTYVFIPVLPASLLEVLNSPTPFIAGVHASLREHIADLLDVITVDLDGGSVHIPECVIVPSITEDILGRVQQALIMILNPSLQYADDAFSPVARTPSPLVLRDKELRAVFIRMFAELFCGYRSSLAVVRIHPSPVIAFHKSHFLGQRDMVDDSFLGRLLDGMAFNAFVAERGPPYRVCDIFDEVSATVQDQLHEEIRDPQRLMENIRELAHHLYMNECTNQQPPFVPLVLEPADGIYTRTNQPPFPVLDGTVVQDVINEGLNNNSSKRLGSSRPQKMRIVPVSGSHGSWSRQRTLENNTRRLEVVRNCVNLIFDNKITEAAKIFPAVLRALKSKVIRLALTQELGEQVRNNRVLLEHQQFDLVVRLLNCALMNDSSLDENGVAAAILPLASAFYRKLCQGVIQFAYTLIQEHAVWENLQFWEQSFYQDVQSQIHQLYLPMYEEHIMLMSKSTDSSEDFNDNMAGDTSSSLKPKKIGPLEITAEQLRIWASMSHEEQQEMMSNEESTVYSQAIHYAYRMVYLRVPVDVSRSFKNISMEENASIFTPSVAESDSFDAESGFDETEHADVAAVVTKFVSRFVDKVCSEAGVAEGHFKSLQQLIPGIVAMHIETLEGVNRESKQLPPVQKPRILQPLLLPGEEIVMEGLRAYLLPDGREEGAGGSMGGPSLLPSEGAVFLTSYRVIFRGMPCDHFACEKIVMRCFPVSSLTKEKKISLQHYLPQGHQVFQEGLQLRSTVFQLMKIAFDGEVSPDNIETFWKLVHRVRYPATVFHTFAFSGHTVHPSTQMRQKSKENISLREFAKQKLLKTARKAGLKKPSKTKLRHSIAGPLPAHHRDGDHSPHSSDSESESAMNVHYGDLTVIDENDQTRTYSNDPKNIERLMERHAYQDYQRLGLGSVTASGQRGSSSDQFRVSTVNANYMLSKSYPGLLVVPQAVSDDSIRKFCRCNRHSRFPVITWRHPKTRALLLRASSFHSRSLGAMLRHSSIASTCSSGDSSSTLELGKYLALLISATPSSSGDPITSLDLLIKARLMAESPGHLSTSESRSTMTQGHSIDKRISSTSPRPISHGRSQEPSRSPNISRRQHTAPGAVSGDLINNRMKHMAHVALYVFGEKSQMKGLKTDASLRCDFIPVDLCEIRQVKASFKKLLRACVPSSPLTSTDRSFHRAVEDCEWLQQLTNILQLSGAVVDLIDAQGSSVMISLEDGWDVTTQVVSLAQLMLDPYYRTIEGFKTLIEKEWLGFGHRFSHRNNQTAAAQASGLAPIFLQFLDAVHQIHRQFPLSFEFSEYFLRYLAYHCVSNRFRTFMFDSELERVESGWLLEEQGVSFSDHDLDHQPHVSSLLEPSQPVYSESRRRIYGASLWDHVDKLCKQSPVFFNVAYAMEDQDPILRPFANISNLKIWSFFTAEDLRHGALYDLDLMEDAVEEYLECSRTGARMRKTLNACYHTIFIQQPDFFWHQIQEIQRLEAELGKKSSPWRTIFDRLECPARDQVSQDKKLVWFHSHTLQRRSTLEILMQGKMLGDIALMFSQPHRFERHMYTSSTYCDHCSKVLWGLSKTGFKCVDCGYNCHDKCQSNVPKNCQKLKAFGDPGLSTSPHLQGNDSPDSTTEYQTAKVSEHRTCSGYLYKQGQLFRQWKQRWFLLDTMKHQLRYYDTQDDHNCKGFIDLSEVESVNLLLSVPGAPKKAVDHSFIEIRAVRKVYNFMAADSTSAADWVEKLQGCLQRE